MFRTIALLFLIISSFSLLSAQEAPFDARQALIVDEIPREYVIHVAESYTGETPVPLVIALHQTASSPEAMQAMTDLNLVADDIGGIVVYPESNGLGWNDGQIAAGISKFENPADDVAFVAQLIGHVAESYTIDRDRVSLVGFGGGAVMTLRIACEQPELFERVISVGVLMRSYLVDLCPETASGTTNLLLVHGISDPFYQLTSTTYPAQGGVDLTFDNLGLEETLDYWTDFFGCEYEPDGKIDNIMIQDDCANGGQVSYFGVIGGVMAWYRVGDYHFNQYGIDVTHLVADFLTATGDDWVQAQTAFGEEHPRSYTVYVPETYDPSVKTPVVMVLHGRPSNGIAMAFITDMNTTSDKHNFIVVYPDAQFLIRGDAVDRFWGYTRGLNYYVPVAEDDVQYLKDLLDDVAHDFNVDRERAYVTGFSNGGFMSHRMACESYDTFAAFAPVGAGGYAGMDELCDFTPPVPLLYMHGTHDVSIPFEGRNSTIVVAGQGEVGIWDLWPAIGTLTYWVAHNGCDDNEYEQQNLTPSGETSVTIVEFGGCEEHPVRFYLIANGGHNWPGVPGVISEQIAGKVNTDIHASEEIWQFFSRFTLNGLAEQDDS